MFGALVTFAQAHIDTLQRPDGRPSYESLTYWAKAVSLLKEQLQDPDRCANDAAILSNVYLMGAAARFQEQQACNTFYQGIQQMVAIRGGLDQLGLGGYVRDCILYLAALGLDTVDMAGETESSATDVSAFPTPTSDTQSPNVVTQGANDPPLTYPQHPFSPRLCEIIARLPVGFADLAMDGCLSHDLIYAAERIFHFANQTKMVLLEHGPTEHVYELKKLAVRIASGSINPVKQKVEQIVCLGLTMLCLEVFTAMGLSRINEARWKLIKYLFLDPDKDEEADSKVVRELKAWFLIMASRAGSEEGVFSPDGHKVDDVLMDQLLDSDSGAAQSGFARRWKGKHGLRHVLTKFFLDPKLESEWYTVWRAHMERKGLKITPADDDQHLLEIDEESMEDESAARADLLRSLQEKSMMTNVEREWHARRGMEVSRSPILFGNVDTKTMYVDLLD